MENETNTNEQELPKAEELKPQGSTTDSAASSETDAVTKKPRRSTYRPSHKATALGIGAVIVILLINVGIVWYVMRDGGEDSTAANREDVIVSTEVLEGLGVSKNPVENEGTELIVGPDSRFNGSLTVADDVQIAGELTLNSRFSADAASLGNLQAGRTELQDLNVNGDGSLSNLAVRQNMSVAGTTQFQGPITASLLVTIANNLNVSGNLSVGGVLSAGNFQTNSLTVGADIVIGGHVQTRGSAPGVSGGAARGSNGTVSISGNDTSGTVAVNVGTGGGNGTLASISFNRAYSSTPHVVVTSVNKPAGNMYITRSASGFSIHVANSLSPGGYAFDYIVMQ